MKLLTAASQTPTQLIFIMYGGLIIFFLYKIFKTNLAKKSLKGNLHRYGKNVTKALLILGVMIIGFGLYSIYNKEYASGILMISLVVVLFIEYSSKNTFAENGFVIEGNFVEWNQVKKWAFNVEKGELVVSYKKGYEEKTNYMRLNPQEIPEVDGLFKKLKLKK